MGSVSKKADRGIVGFQRVEAALDRNASFRERHQDRFNVQQLPDAPDASRYAGEMENFFGAAFKRLRETKYGALTGEPEQDREKGGTTCTLAFYDPKSFTLEIGSKGDSPAFILLRDKSSGKAAAIRVTSTKDIKFVDNRPTNTILNSAGTGFPMHRGTYHFRQDDLRNDGEEGLIDLRKLKEGACRERGLNAENTEMTLMAASDGVLSLTDLQMAELVSRHSDSEANLAEALVKEAIEKGSADNVSVVCVRNLKPGRGNPVAVCLCDGFGAQGKAAAHLCVDMFKDFVKALHNTPPESTVANASLETTRNPPLPKCPDRQ